MNRLGVRTVYPSLALWSPEEDLPLEKASPQPCSCGPVDPEELYRCGFSDCEAVLSWREPEKVTEHLKKHLEEDRPTSTPSEDIPFSMEGTPSSRESIGLTERTDSSSRRCSSRLAFRSVLPSYQPSSFEDDEDKKSSAKNSNCSTKGVDSVSNKKHTDETPIANGLSVECFGDNINLVTLSKIHTHEKYFGCEQCGKNFLRRNELIIHLRTHTEEKPYTCDLCSRSFSQRSNLTQHQIIHSDERPFSCEQCAKGFKKKFSLTSHMRTHSGEKPFSCSQCGDKFTYCSQLKRHRKLHTGEKPFVCESCNQRFTEKTQLKIHRRTHIGEKPFECKECSKRFSHQGNLKVHDRRHTGERPYKCHICGDEFIQSSILRVHLSIHSDERSYTCEECGKKYKSKSSLTKHSKNCISIM